MDAPDNYGWTALIVASDHGYVDIIGLLLDAGKSAQTHSLNHFYMSIISVKILIRYFVHFLLSSLTVFKVRWRGGNFQLILSTCLTTV